ncbi:MAG: DUF1993 family protein [Pseudomonadales bacterium]|jgi:hypothetical protein
MSLSLSQVVIPSYQQILPSVIQIMKKGGDHFTQAGRSPDDIVGLKIIDDMLPMHFQIVSVVHHSRVALGSALSGEAGIPDGSLQMDFAGLCQYLEDALEAVNSADGAAIDARADEPVTFRMGERSMPFTTSNFLLSFSLPNFYFHASTTYDLLRGEGVKLGKRDFLGALRLSM